MRQQIFTEKNFVKHIIQKISEVGLSETFGNALGSAHLDKIIVCQCDS